MYNCFIPVVKVRRCISTAPELGREPGTNDWVERRSHYAAGESPDRSLQFTI